MAGLIILNAANNPVFSNGYTSGRAMAAQGAKIISS
jgi:hypothetical protein